MKKDCFLLFLLLSCMLSCKKEDDKVTMSKPLSKLPETIDENRTLKSDTVYTFDVSVTVTDSAVLTIEPGTVIKFVKGKGSVGYFAITRGAKIMAEGTPDKPIVFTSGKPAGERMHGDWLGLYIFGKAPIAAFDESIFMPGKELALPAAMGAGGPIGGGEDPADNSGVLKYVRIEFAGNTGNGDGYGLACVGVGSGTTIDHVQVSYTQVSGFAFYGGTVNATHLVAFNNRLAGIVYANGYTGKQQFVLSYKHPYFGSTGSAAVYTSDGLLVFNDLRGYQVDYNTRPVLSNVTVVGPYKNPGYNSALVWNAGLNVMYSGTFALRNSILMGMPKGGIKFSDDMAAQNLLNGMSEFGSNLVHSNVYEDAFTINTDMVYSVDTATLNAYATEHLNKKYTTPDEIGLTDPFNYSQPGLGAKDGGVDFSGSDYDGFFTKVNYVGAVGKDNNWLAEKWVNFYPVDTDY